MELDSFGGALNEEHIGTMYEVISEILVATENVLVHYDEIQQTEIHMRLNMDNCWLYRCIEVV